MSDVQLICGQFEKLDLSSLGPVDLCFADPPDNIGKGYDNYTDRLPKAEYRQLIKEWLRRCCQVTSGPVFFTFAEQYIPDVEDAIREHKLELVQRCWWVFSFGQAQRVRYTSALRPIYWLNDKRVFPERVRIPSKRQTDYHDKRANPDGKMPNNVWEFARICGTFREKRKWHPCQIPEAMLNKIIGGHSAPGDTILDPFSGSGSAIYCADKLGRRAIGIDQSQSYLDKTMVELQKRQKLNHSPEADNAQT